MRKSKNTSCPHGKQQKCLSCQRKSVARKIPDFTLCDAELDLIVGGMHPSELQRVKELAAADMGLTAFTPGTYFQ